MTWIVNDDDEDQFIKELHSHPDRAAGLLGQAIVDRRLTAAIKGRWKSTGDLFDSLFHPSGPLGSFATRIKIGFAIQLYGLEAYNDLKQINKIRNELAHSLVARHFNTDSIRSRANNLVLPSRYPISNEAVVFTPNSPTIIWDMAVS